MRTEDVGVISDELFFMVMFIMRGCIIHINPVCEAGYAYST